MKLRFHSIRILLRFEVLTAVVMGVAVFWEITPYSPYMNPRFIGMYHFHLQGGKSAEQETIVAFSRWLGLATH
jgi:hypothetical protein